MINNKYIFLLFLFAGLYSQDKGQKLFQEKKYAEARKYYETVLGQRNDDKAALFGCYAASKKVENFGPRLSKKQYKEIKETFL